MLHVQNQMPDLDFFFFMFSRNGRCAGSAKENAPHGISI